MSAITDTARSRLSKIYYIYSLVETYGVIANTDVSLGTMFNYYLIIKTLLRHEANSFLTATEQLCLEGKLKRIPTNIGCNCY